MPQKIFPFIFTKVSNYSSSDIRFLASNELIIFVDKMERDGTILKRYTSLICQILYRKISRVTNEHQKALLCIKRKVYNFKSLTSSEEQQLYKNLIPNEFVVYEKYRKWRIRLTHLENEYQDTYNNEVIKIRQSLLSLSRSQRFLEMLSLTNPDLYRCIVNGDYQFGNGKKLNHKFKSLENSLLSYLTRAAVKTSPMGGLTDIEVAKFNNDLSSIGNCLEERRQYFTLNISIFSHLKAVILPELVLHFNPVLLLNETTKTEQGFCICYTGSEGSFHRNVIEYSAISAAVLQNLSIKNHTKNSLITEMYGDGVFSKEDTLYTLFELTQKGFIQTDIGIGNSDIDWCVRLRNYLSNFQTGSECLKAIYSLLDELESVRLKLDALEPEGKFSALQEARQLILDHKKFQMRMHLAGRREKHSVVMHPDFLKFDDKTLFYKTTIINRENKKYGTPAVNAVCNSMDILIRSVPFVDRNLYHRRFITAFFKKKYAYKRVSLLDLYKDVTQELARHGNSIFAVLGEIDPDLVDDYNTSVNDFIDALWKRVKYEELRQEIKFDDIDLSEVATSMDQPIRGDMSNSFCCHAQVIPGDSGDTQSGTVINGINLGFGKMVGRYLPFVPAEITRLITEMNNSSLKCSDSVLCENSDNAHLSVNVRPGLLQNVLSIPGGAYIPENALPIDQLYVELPSFENSLMIKDLKGRRVVLHDVDLSVAKKRSALFQFAAKLIAGDNLDLFPLIYLLVKRWRLHKKTHLIPRIVMNNNIVLQRKGWTFHNSDLDFAINADEHQAYNTVNKWRITQTIPIKCFVTGYNKFEDKKLQIHTTNNQKISCKPQYIDFSSPLLVVLFLKIVRQSGHSFLIEEFLPDTNPDNEAGLSSEAIEHIFQWYSSS